MLLLKAPGGKVNGVARCGTTALNRSEENEATVVMASLGANKPNEGHV